MFDEQSFILNCPHCQEFLMIHKEEIKCAIFRHGIYNDSLEPIDPHTPKNICEKLVEEKKIYGCGKPFQLFIDVSGQPFTQECDYI
jgi:hypothetical protein